MAADPGRIAGLSALLLAAAPAAATERSVAVTNFDRVRVDGPFAVEVSTRATPLATVSGDARALDLVDVRVEGGTLTVRANRAVWGERPAVRGIAPPVIRVQTRDLRSLGVVGSGTLTVTGPITAPRLDVSLTGIGSIAAPGLAVDQVQVTVLGDGAVSLGGAARSARLVGSGAGRIAAPGLTANDVTIRTEGATRVSVTARYTAAASSTGVGAIEILGKPDCKGKAQAGAPIICGGKRL